MNGAELTRFVRNGKPKMPDQNRMNYVIELLENDRDSFEPLVEISRLLSNNDVDLRALTTLKQQLFNSDNGALTAVSIDKFSSELATFLSGYKDCK